jgi:hypothetical protein
MQKKEFVFVFNGGTVYTRIRPDLVKKTDCYSKVKKVWKKIYKFLPTVGGPLAVQTSTPILIDCDPIKSESGI